MEKNKLPKFLAVVAVVFLMISLFIINKYKAKINEAAKLPFYKIELSDVEDGIYKGKTYTSFAHLQLKVFVENHQIKEIEILECDGLEVVKAKNVVQEMTKNNKIVVPAKKGEEIGTMIFISCVDCALSGVKSE